MSRGEFPRCGRCGHSRSYHRRLLDMVTFMVRGRRYQRWQVMGHGACRAKRCECPEFTQPLKDIVQ